MNKCLSLFFRTFVYNVLKKCNILDILHFYLRTFFYRTHIVCVCGGGGGGWGGGGVGEGEGAAVRPSKFY